MTCNAGQVTFEELAIEIMKWTKYTYEQLEAMSAEGLDNAIREAEINKCSRENVVTVH